MLSKLITGTLVSFLGISSALASGPMEIPQFGFIYCENAAKTVELQVIRSHISENKLLVNGEELQEPEMLISRAQVTEVTHDTGDNGEAITKSKFFMNTQISGRISTGSVALKTKLFCEKAEISDID